MFDVSPINLHKEALAAIEHRRALTNQSARSIKRYASDRYRDDMEPDGKAFENVEFEVAATILPTLVYQDPQVTVTRGEKVQDDITEAMQMALNRLVRDVDLAAKLEKIALDCLFDFGVAEVYMEPAPGFDPHRDDLDRSDGQMYLRPNVARVSPRLFFIDPVAPTIDEARYMGKIFFADKDALLAVKDADGKPVYDEAAVLEAVGDWDDDRHRQDIDLVQGAGSAQVERSGVIGYEIFVPETGMLYCISANGSGRYLRQPRKFRGSPAGPWVVFGLHDVPDNVYPLPWMSVMSKLSEELNAHSGAIARDAGETKRLHAIDSQIDAVRHLMTSAVHNSVISIPGLASGTYKPIEMGGVNPDQLGYTMTLRDRIDRRIGISEAVRGAPSSNKTATADSIAATAAASKFKKAAARFKRGVKSVLWRMGWLMFHDPLVRVRIPAQGQDLEFQGGLAPGQDQSLFTAMNFDIDPYSMELTADAIMQARAQELLGLIARVAPAIPQTPWVNWGAVLDDWGNAYNHKDLGSRYLNLDLAAQAGAMMPADPDAGGGGGGGGGSGMPGPVDETDMIAAELSRPVRGVGGVV